MKKVLQLFTIVSLFTASLSAKPIHDAAKRGDLAAVQRLLDDDANVNVQDDNGWTPLHLAANNYHTETVQFLINRGANVDVTGYDGLTPLHWAAQNDCACTEMEQLLCTEMAQLLIDHGANTDTRNVYGGTPLHWAACYGHTEMAQLLINNGANIDAQNKDGITPLFDAARWDRAETARLLIDCGANANAQTNKGETPLHVAAYWSNTKTAQLIKTLPLLNKLLWHAVLKNDLLNARWLLAQGASPHAIALESMFFIPNETPEKVVNYLNAVIARKDTMLHVAVEHENIDMVKLLLAFGGQIDRPNKAGTAALDLAVNYPEVLDVILAAADPTQEPS